MCWLRPGNLTAGSFMDGAVRKIHRLRVSLELRPDTHPNTTHDLAVESINRGPPLAQVKHTWLPLAPGNAAIK